LTDAQKAAVIALVQKEYDDALGKGVVTVSEGSGGTVDMIVNGSQAPGVNKGKEYGDMGTKDGPGIVVQLAQASTDWESRPPRSFPEASNAVASLVAGDSHQHAEDPGGSAHFHLGSVNSLLLH